MLTYQSDLLFELSKSAYIDSGYFTIAAEKIAEAACTGLNIRRVGVWLFSDDQRDLYCVAFCENWVCKEIDDGRRIARANFPGLFEAMLANRLVAADDVRTNPVTAEFHDFYTVRAGIVSILIVPVRLEGKIMGLISCEQKKTPRHWTDEDQDFVIALAEVASRGLGAERRQRVEDELRLARTDIDRQVSERTHTLRTALEQLQEAQLQLIQTEKMASLGALVAGVAHEINTPIGISVTAASHLKSSTRQIQKDMQSGTLKRADFEAFMNDAIESADILLRNLERAANLVQSFKRVAVHHSDEGISSFDLREALADLVLSVSPECKRHGIACKLDCEPGFDVHSYQGALDQIVTNLIVNALRHAFDRSFDGAPDHSFDNSSGTISISARIVDNQVDLKIADNGAGIKTELLPRIFDPFVTTKRGEGGSGLGLHIVFNLVTYRLKGRVAVSSIEGSGTEFRCLFPARLEPETAAP